MEPSRPDAVRLRRNEKLAVLHLMYAVSVFEDLPQDLCDRIGMVRDGPERTQEIIDKSNSLLDELRVTIPENQRNSIQNTADDYIIRLTPNSSPGETNIILTKDEYRNLVDCARVKCRECILDDTECEGCELFQLLTTILPLNDYHSLNLCPYNLGEWKN